MFPYAARLVFERVSMLEVFKTYQPYTIDRTI